jgi:hypothetical protein
MRPEPSEVGGSDGPRFVGDQEKRLGVSEAMIHVAMDALLLVASHTDVGETGLQITLAEAILGL